MRELAFEKKEDIIPEGSIAALAKSNAPISVYQKEIEGIQVISTYSHINRLAIER